MGETRIRRSKRASKAPIDAPRNLDQQFQHLRIDEDQVAKPSRRLQESVYEVQASDTVTSENEDTIPDPNLIEVRYTDNKGYAVFAAQKIAAGTLLLAESPMIHLTQSEEDADKSNSTDDKHTPLHGQFDSLSKPTQKSYLALFDSEKSGFSKVKSIYYSNCYNLSGANKPSKSSQGGSCIGLVASRVNHSCLPNVQFSFDELRHLMLFHAIKAIPKGRELGSNYDSIYELRAQRQRRQMLYYGFRCDCEACEPGQSEFWMRSDERRKAMVEIRNAVKQCEKTYEETGRLDVGQDPVVALQRLDGLLVKEGLLGLPVMDTYRSLARWVERAGDTKAAKGWRQRELNACLITLGSRSVRARDLTAKLNQLN